MEGEDLLRNRTKSSELGSSEFFSLTIRHRTQQNLGSMFILWEISALPYLETNFCRSFSLSGPLTCMKGRMGICFAHQKKGGQRIEEAFPAPACAYEVSACVLIINTACNQICFRFCPINAKRLAALLSRTFYVNYPGDQINGKDDCGMLKF